MPRIDELRSQTKQFKGKPTPEQLEEIQRIKEELQAAEEELAAAEAARDALLADVPNPPHDSAPDGGEDDAVELRTFGDATVPDGVREASEVGRFEIERATRLSGSRFGYLVGDTALLAMALYRYALDVVGKAGFTPVIPPVLVREEAMYGTGFFPTDRGNIYALEADELYLTGTSEVALGGMHMGEILEAADLPIRYTGFSTCFRREAGAAGKDTRGMFRVHQFNKVEMFVFIRPEDVVGRARPHGRARGAGAPGPRPPLPRGQHRRAATSAPRPRRRSTSRRGSPRRAATARSRRARTRPTTRRAASGIRWRSERGLEPPHTLNGTVVTDRVVLAILENFQGAVPDVLLPYGAPAAVSG